MSRRGMCGNDIVPPPKRAPIVTQQLQNASNAQNAVASTFWIFVNLASFLTTAASAALLTIMSAIHPELAPFSIICAILLLLPLPWHWRARNVATLSIIGWLFVCNIIYAVDAHVWGKSIDIVIPVWCDITTKMLIGVGVALPAACICISIHLERISSARVTQNTVEDKRRRRWFEAGMCFGLPAIFIGLHYIVQGHRYDIIEGYGCRPATYFSIPALWLVFIPPIIIACISVIYSAIALRHFLRRRLEFAAQLNACNSSLNTTRYLRLMALVLLHMLCSLNFSVYTLWFTAMSVPIRPWISWADVHSDFLRVDQFPDAVVPDENKRALCVLSYFIPVLTLVFVALFSFGSDAIAEYKKCIAWFRVNVLRRPPLQKVSFADMPPSPSKSSIPASGSRMVQIKHTPFSSRFSQLSSAPRYSTYSTTKTPMDEDNSDALSEITHYDYETPYDKSKSMDTPPTPSTARTFSSETTFCAQSSAPPLPPPPAPLSPPPPNPRLRPLILTPSSVQSGRPTSYPAFVVSSRSIKPPQPLRR